MDRNRISILLVEDEYIVALTEKKDLEKRGYHVHHAGSGEKAVSAVLTDKLPVHIILMDIDLGSGIDGTVAAKRILDHKDIPIVFLSSHTEPEIVDRTEQITSYGYVVKNSGIVVLDASIRMAMKLFHTKLKQKRAEKLIREREVLLNETGKMAKVGGWELDAKTLEVTWTEQTYLIHEVPFGQIPSLEEALNFFHPDDRDKLTAAVKRALTLGEPYDMEMKFTSATGKQLLTRSICKPQMENGEVVKLRGTFQDISERGRIEAELKQKTNELESFFSTALDLLCVADTDGTFRRLNPQWEEVLGYSLNELEGRSFLELVHPEDMQPTIDAISQLSDQRTVNDFVNRYRCKDGSYRWIEWRSYPQGNIIFAAARDITQRKMAQEEVQKQLNEKELLLKEIHHRVKNNIAYIEGFLALQAGSETVPQVKSALQDAVSRVQSMRIMYERLLLDEKYQEISVKEYIESLIEAISSLFPDGEKIAIEKNISDFDLSAKKMTSVGIIFNEILTNAYKYAFPDKKEGTISVELSRDGNTVTLSVHDTGIGFEYSDSSPESQGMGLTIIKMLTEQLNGTFNCFREEGTTSVVQFDI